MRSCSASEACAGSPVPPRSRHVCARELVLAAVGAAGRDRGRVPAGLALRDALERRAGASARRWERGPPSCRQAERAHRRRAGDAVDGEAVVALERAHGGRGLRPVDAVGGDPERPLQRGDAVPAACVVELPPLCAWSCASAAPAIIVMPASSAAAPLRLSRTRRRRRAVSVRRARERRRASSQGPGLARSVVGHSDTSLGLNAYGVSCRARAKTCATPHSGGDSPPAAHCRQWVPRSPPLGDGDSAGWAIPKRGSLCGDRTKRRADVRAERAFPTLRHRVQRLPEVHARRRAVRPPRLGDALERPRCSGAWAARRRARRPAGCRGRRSRTTSGRRRWNIRNMSTVQRPRPLTASSCARDLLVGQRGEAIELELPTLHPLGEIAQVGDLRAREAGRAQRVGLDGEQLGRRRHAAAEEVDQPQRRSSARRAWRAAGRRWRAAAPRRRRRGGRGGAPPRRAARSRSISARITGSAARRCSVAWSLMACAARGYAAARRAGRPARARRPRSGPRSARAGSRRPSRARSGTPSRSSAAPAARAAPAPARPAIRSSAERWRQASPPAAGPLHVDRSRALPQLVGRQVGRRRLGVAQQLVERAQAGRAASSITAASQAGPSCQKWPSSSVSTAHTQPRARCTKSRASARACALAPPPRRRRRRRSPTARWR